MEPTEEPTFDGNYHCAYCGRTFRVAEQVEFIKHQEACCPRMNTWEETVKNDEELKTSAIVYYRVIKGMDIKAVDIDLGFLKQELNAQAELTWHARDKEEVAFLDKILHMPFFEFCLQVKERKELLQAQLKSWGIEQKEGK